MRFDSNTMIIAIAVFLQSTVANAETLRENHCTRYGVTRTVELQVDDDSGAPCRVLYHKPMEDQSTTNLWNARNDAQFCSTRYDAFIVKLESRLNWSCSEAAEHSEPNPSMNVDSALSMKQIEHYIPSGNYVSYKEESHSDNSSLCPSDGYFAWKTESLDKPVFQMGADHEFQFDLASLTDLSIASVSKDVVPRACQSTISAGYCSNEKYNGNTPLHPVFSSYFGCDRSAENTQKQRPLVLVRTLMNSNSSDSECDISEDYQHLALAPSLQSGDSSKTTETYDIELVILPRRTASNSMNLVKGYVCRYVQGS